MSVPAGVKLDRLVAKEVMEWRPSRPNGRYWCDTEAPQRLGNGHTVEAWSPSTNIAHAWEIVERMQRQGMCFRLDSFRDGEGVWPHGFVCEFGEWKADADTAPLAICLAALAATVKEEW